MELKAQSNAFVFRGSSSTDLIIIYAHVLIGTASRLAVSCYECMRGCKRVVGSTTGNEKFAG